MLDTTQTSTTPTTPNAFPASYPGGDDGTALNAQIELITRRLWDGPEFKSALIGGYGVSPDDVLPDLALPEAVDFMLQAFWQWQDLHGPLAAGDFLAAAEILRRVDEAPDEIRIASRASVAAAVKNVVERLAPPR